MDQMLSVDAILFPSDGRAPHLVKLVTTPMPGPDPLSLGRQQARMPHPEVHMDFIAEVGSAAWKYQLVEALDYMNKNFTNPYVIFYPTVSRDGMPFAINKAIREIQGRGFTESAAWRGNIVVAKYRESPFSSLISLSMADFAIMKNYLMTHGAPPS